MTPIDYFQEMLLPTYEEYHSETVSRRRAYLACIVTMHLADYLENAGVRNAQKMMRGKATDAWNMVHAVAIGAKHSNNDLSKKNPTRFTAGEDYHRPPAIVGQMECGVSMLGDYEGSMVIRPQEPWEIDLLSSLRQVIAAYLSLFGREHLWGCEFPSASHLS